jgi:pimeloyl-ACP methyl ester carboxylesterase
VIHGEGSVIMDRKAAERVAAAVRRGTLVSLPGAFHHLVLDDPAGFVTAVDDSPAPARE